MSRPVVPFALALASILGLSACGAPPPTEPRPQALAPAKAASPDYSVQDWRSYFHKHYYPGTDPSLYWVHFNNTWVYIRRASRWRFVRGWVYMYTDPSLEWRWVWVPYVYDGWLYIWGTGWIYAGFRGGISGGLTPYFAGAPLVGAAAATTGRQFAPDQTPGAPPVGGGAPPSRPIAAPSVGPDIEDGTPGGGFRPPSGPPSGRPPVGRTRPVDDESENED